MSLDQLTYGDSEMLSNIQYLTVFQHGIINQPPNLELGWYEPARKSVAKQWKPDMRLLPLHQLRDSYSMCAEWVSTQEKYYCEENWVVCPKSCPNTFDIPVYKGYMWKIINNDDYYFDDVDGGDTNNEGGDFNHDGINEYRDNNTVGGPIIVTKIIEEKPVGTVQLQQQQKIQLGWLFATGLLYLLFRYVRPLPNQVQRKRL